MDSNSDVLDYWMNLIKATEPDLATTGRRLKARSILAVSPEVDYYLLAELV